MAFRLNEKRSGNSSLILSVGMMLSTLIVGPFAVDFPTYMCVQQQLQTATDAAALAGAANLPFSQTDAEAEAYRIAAKNIVAGHELQPNDLSYAYKGGAMIVRGQVEMPTVTAKLLCGFQLEEEKKKNPNGAQAESVPSCGTITVTAGSKAIPAPRDTMLVLDTSGSMAGTPIRDVKNSSKAFIDIIDSMNSESVDRVGLVNFDLVGKLQIGLSSKIDSQGYSAVKSKINGLQLATDSVNGFQTNYKVGLEAAIDELVAHGRSNAHKTIVFFTDGKPNLPNPNSPAITQCVSYKNQRRDALAKACAQDYVNHMISQTDIQIQRAADLGITIHTIEIGDPNQGNIFQTLLMQRDWNPGLLDKMARKTEGAQFAALREDTQAIREIFLKVAKLVTVKLTG